MGQYHLIVNLDRREFIDPHQLDVGLKAWEQLATFPGTPQALLVLLLCSNGRGSGDLKRSNANHGVIGRWAGERIAAVGDYASDSDLKHQAEPSASEIYSLCRKGEFRDISDLVRPILAAELGVEYEQHKVRTRYLDGSVTTYTTWRVTNRSDSTPT